MINSATFVANVDLLARYVAAVNGQLLPALACSVVDQSARRRRGIQGGVGRQRK